MSYHYRNESDRADSNRRVAIKRLNVINEQKDTIAKQAEEIEALKAEVERWESKDQTYANHIIKTNNKLKESEAEVERLKAELKTRAKQIGIACMEHDLTHSLACGRCYAESEAVVKVLAEKLNESMSITDHTVEYLLTEQDWIQWARLEAARQEAKTKASVTKNNADLRRRKEQVYGPSHICYCGVSVGSCQCPKEEGIPTKNNKINKAVGGAE